MNGFAIIFLGLVSFGLLHSKVNKRPKFDEAYVLIYGTRQSDNLAAWQW
jgi:hypothetical protein